MAAYRKLWPYLWEAVLVTGTDLLWAELGRRVKQRRSDLGLGQNELGPSDLTIRKLERGTGVNLRQSTLGQIEAALKWRPGTIDDILAGKATEEQLAEVVQRVTPAVAMAASGAMNARTAIDSARADDIATAAVHTKSGGADVHGAGASRDQVAILARAAQAVGQALVDELAFAQRTARIYKVIDLLQEALNLILDEQAEEWRYRQQGHDARP